MTCDETKDRLLELISGELAAHDEESVRRHVATCTDCRAELAELESISALVREVPLEEPPARLDRAILERAHAKAAEIRGEAPRAVASRAVAPEPRSYWHGLALQIGRFISGPQVAMATVMVLIVAIGVWYGPMSGRRDESLGESEAPGEIVADEGAARGMATPETSPVVPSSGEATLPQKEQEISARAEADPRAGTADPQIDLENATRSATPPQAPRRKRSPETQPAAGRSASSGGMDDLLDSSGEQEAYAPKKAQAPAYATESKSDNGAGASLGALSAPAAPAKVAAGASRDESAAPSLATARDFAGANECTAAVAEYGRFIAASGDAALRAIAYREQAECYSKLGNTKDASAALALAKAESAKAAAFSAKRSSTGAKAKKAQPTDALMGLE